MIKADLNISANSSKYNDSTTADTFVVNYATIVTYNEDDLKSFLHNQIQKRITTFMSAIEILEDIKDLRELFFSFNVQNGISPKAQLH